MTIRKRPIIGLRIKDDGSPAYMMFIRTEEVTPGEEPVSKGNQPIVEMDEWGAQHLHLQLSNALGFRGGVTPEGFQKLENALGADALASIMKDYHLIPREEMQK